MCMLVCQSMRMYDVKNGDLFAHSHHEVDAFVDVCVCVCACMAHDVVWTCININTYTCILTYILKYECVFLYRHVWLCYCLDMLRILNTFLRIFTSVWALEVYVSIHACMHACMYSCLLISLFIAEAMDTLCSMILHMSHGLSFSAIVETREAIFRGYFTQIHTSLFSRFWLRLMHLYIMQFDQTSTTKTAWAAAAGYGSYWSDSEFSCIRICMYARLCNSSGSMDVMYVCMLWVHALPVPCSYTYSTWRYATRVVCTCVRAPVCVCLCSFVSM